MASFFKYHVMIMSNIFHFLIHLYTHLYVMVLGTPDNKFMRADGGRAIMLLGELMKVSGRGIYLLEGQLKSRHGSACLKYFYTTLNLAFAARTWFSVGF